jgi:hypothetical protein
MHIIFKPSFDIQYHGTMLRASPGLFYWGVGLEQRIGYYRKASRGYDRPLYLHFSYHDDWFLTNIRRAAEGNTARRDLDIYTMMLGMRANLDRLKRVHMQVSLGASVVVEKFNPVNGVTPDNRVFPLPMVEVRLGAFVQRHKYYRQKLPQLKEPKPLLGYVVKIERKGPGGKDIQKLPPPAMTKPSSIGRVPPDSSKIWKYERRPYIKVLPDTTEKQKPPVEKKPRTKPVPKPKPDDDGFDFDDFPPADPVQDDTDAQLQPDPEADPEVVTPEPEPKPEPKPKPDPKPEPKPEPKPKPVEVEQIDDLEELEDLEEDIATPEEEVTEDVLEEDVLEEDFMQEDILEEDGFEDFGNEEFMEDDFMDDDLFDDDLFDF